MFSFISNFCFSTTSQALDVALKMQAKHVILTHISQRYPRMPIIKDTELAEHTVFAFDHMEVFIDSLFLYYFLVVFIKFN